MFLFVSFHEIVRHLPVNVVYIKPLKQGNYRIIFTVFGFFISPVGLVFIFFMVDKIGRKMVQLVAFVGSAVFLTALFICTRR